MNRIYNIDKEKLLFSNKALFALLIPVVFEQLLNSFMGMADTMMVSRVGSTAISAVSLVDSINLLVIQVFSALAAGAAIVCSQFIGSRNLKMANESARQVVLTVFTVSMFITLTCVVLCKPIIRVVFGQIEQGVMDNCEIYFLITALSFPFIALFSAGSSFLRAGGNSRYPMKVSVISNFVNIAGNALLIFGFGMGVAGAALSTLVSRAFCMLVIFAHLRKQGEPIVLTGYHTIRPDFSLIARILKVGIPSGIENGMFQFGKLAIQSSVSTLGTAAIAAQAMTVIFENVNGVAGLGIGIGLMTVIGQCIGAGEKEQAKYYMLKITGWAWIATLISCLFVFAISKPVIYLAGMEAESAALCFYMITWITIIKPLFWTLSFIPAYGLRAAGDVGFPMIVSICTMWFLRVALAVFLIRGCGFGPIAVWIGMFADWTVRGIIFTARYFSMRWTGKKII